MKISKNKDGSLNVPNTPVIPFIEGDGIGPDIWRASVMVLDGAVKAAYKGEKKISWLKILAGEEAHEKTGEWLPKETILSIKEHVVAIKGPLTTPVGEGIRSLNVSIRHQLDLFACVRPVKYIEGVPSPMKRPEEVDMVIFRENTEDLYAGIEWEAQSKEARKVISLLNDNMGTTISPESGIGIKPMSAKNSKRLISAAIEHAIANNYPSVTLMHKGNIMKFTEGAFSKWGYEVAKEKYGKKVISESEVYEKHGGEPPKGKVVIKDRIADMLFQQVLLRPLEYHVIATPNLNGDYMSDALSAQVGGLGMAPGANIGADCAVFEATHGSAPKYTGLDKVNPCSLILSGAMMLDYLGWTEAGGKVREAIAKTIQNLTVTYDLARQIEGAKEVSCSEFGRLATGNLGQ